MAKTKSERLKLVVELAQRQEEQAAERLNHARRYLDQQTQQLDTLKSYLDDYLSKMKSTMQGVQSVANLQQNQSFAQQLGGAIQQQELMVDHAKVQFEDAKKVWVGLREKSSSLAQIRDTAQRNELHSREVKEEKMIQDEYQSRRAYQQ